MQDALRTLAAAFGAGMTEYGQTEEERRRQALIERRQREQDELALADRKFKAQAMGFRDDVPTLPENAGTAGMAGMASDMVNRGLNAAQPRADVPGVGRMLAPDGFGLSERQLTERDMPRNTRLLAGAFGGRPGFTADMPEVIARGLASPGELFASPNYLPSAGGTPAVRGGGPTSPTVIAAARRAMASRYIKSTMSAAGVVNPDAAWQALQGSPDMAEAQRLGVTLEDIRAAAADEVTGAGRLRPTNPRATPATPAPTLAELLSTLKP